MRSSTEPPPTVQHLQEATELSTTETIIPDHIPPGLVVAEPESTIGEPTPLRTSTKIKRERQYEQLPLTVIPPAHSNRTLVLCFDGTGDEFDADNSNVVHLCSLLKKDEPDKQMVYYQSGIGTVSHRQFITPIASALSKTLDQMVAYSLDSQVMEGYEFLMQSYARGDKICIFGFSRGAYTARALAGMLHKVGLLPPNNHNQVPFAYKLFTDTTLEGWNQSNAFKRSFSIDVEIEFLGVWDTVNSVGIIPRRLPFTTSNKLVKTFRHALALDEHRAKFQPNVWNRPTAEECKLGEAEERPVPKTPPPTQKTSPQQTLKTRLNILPLNILAHASKQEGSDTKDSVGRHQSTQQSAFIGRWDTDEEEVLLNKLERTFSERHTKDTDIKEVWFAGCHSDVGGGSVSNYESHSLARIPLRWMIRECFSTNTGIMFDADGLRELGMDPSALYPLVLPSPPPLSAADLRLPVETVPTKPFYKWFGSLFSSHHDKYSEERLPSTPADLEAALEAEHEHGPLDQIKASNEQVEELLDALSPVHDQLKLRKAWWLLEFMPVELTFQRSDDTIVSRTVLNLGRPRKVVEQKDGEILVHRSVKTRMEAPYCQGPDGTLIPKRYVPKARFKVKTATWVD